MKKTRIRRSAGDSNSDSQIDRRSFVKLLPAATAAGLTMPAVEGAPVQNRRNQQAAQKVTREMMHAAEQLIGIELTEAHEAMALSGVNRNLSSYEALRKIDVPLDTEPAMAFHPALPGKLKQYRDRKGVAGKPKTRASKVD